MVGRRSFKLLGATAALLMGLTSTACRKPPEPARGRAADWPHYGRDEGGSRYSPLNEITPENVRFLKVAWRYRTGDVSDGKHGLPKSAFEATPLLIDGTLYVVTPMNRIVALDPETGAHRWTFDARPALSGDYGDGLVCRGIASWHDSSTGRLYLYMATQDGRLVAIDGNSGRAVEGFGRRGAVDLKTGIVIERVGEYHFTSPPAVVRDTVVVGSAINDNNRTTMPAGVVRGYDARTGALRWNWDPVPREPADRAYKTWENDSALRSGAANAWAPLSTDTERDLVFVPTGSASVDHYGGERKGSNIYADSVVALRGSTGRVVWYFQTVHHNVWDYDVPAQPTLITLRRDGREIPAVAQATKVGHLFVLHRENGEPLFEVEERPVPQTDVPGEQTYPTQPFPVLPAALTPQRIRPEDAWGLTRWDRRACRDEIALARNEGVFTPPSLRGTVVYPGLIGGTNWGGVAFDPDRQLLVLNNSRLPFIVRLVRRDQVADARKKKPDSEFAPMRGTPYAMQRYALLSPFGLPCSPPPWGTILAVDLQTGQKRWESTLGTIRDLAPVPLPIQWGTPNMGGPLMTAGGVTFIAAAMDNYLRAFDSESGEELWKARLAMATVKAKKTESLIDVIQELQDRIARRAYDIFSNRGGLHGSDLEDWCRAESEVAWKPAMELVEKDGKYLVQLVVAGVDSKDLDVRVTPQQLLVQANIEHQHKGEEGTVHRCEFSAGKLFRCVEFPKSINPDSVKAECRNGLLQVVSEIAAEEPTRRVAAESA